MKESWYLSREAWFRPVFPPLPWLCRVFHAHEGVVVDHEGVKNGSELALEAVGFQFLEIPINNRFHVLRDGVVSALAVGCQILQLCSRPLVASVMCK